MQHTKLKRLVRALKIPQYAAVGILESLWHLTAREAIRGNIGKLLNEDIASGIDWREQPDALVDALVASGWLDIHETERLVVHDWHVHSDDATDIQLARTIQFYANGEMPRMGRLSKAERELINAQYATLCAQDRTESHKKPLPLPLPKPEPLPEPIKKVQIPSAVAVIDLPEWIDREVWNAYLEMRKKKRAVPTDRALKGILTQLGIFRNKGHNANAVLDTSIRSNWTDVYEPKTGAANGNGKTSQPANRALERQQISHDAIRAAVERRLGTKAGGVDGPDAGLLPEPDIAPGHAGRVVEGVGGDGFRDGDRSV